jgi:hypothetical protein
MTDLRMLLHEASTSVRHAPAAGSVEADLLRGRRGLRRHRILLGARTGMLAAAAVGVVAVAVQSGLLPVGGSAAPPPVAQPAPSVARPVPTPGLPTVPQPVALVSYRGEQPVGFLVDKVPAGWEVQGADTGTLTLAPIGAADQDIHSWAGKIAVLQGDQLPDGLTGTEVEVGGARGLVFQMEGGDDGTKGGKNLFVEQPSGTYLEIQTPPELGWSDRQLAEFGAGVQVTDDAVTSVG